MICKDCSEEKDVSLFHLDNRRKNPITDVCETCFNTRNRIRHRDDKRRYRSDDPEKVRVAYRTWQRQRLYGMSDNDFIALFETQGNKCAICGSKESNWTRGWHIDHDHSCCSTTPTCGKCTRGVLCHKCNLMLGLSNDDPKIHQKALNYLTIKNRKNLE